ncbi:hypothetical protein Ctob_001784 [Chrysochromulina tobinii]|uniref:Uncharacterized protein n=1 Tax=Chrysochromulina tobinii TaxID=1460289 RepID=A0A0M0J5X6_9EUKA|nr:hypothetical protein Ctob_001784 [Chrysochromulina tobinii]|eukprot:KOO21623.1 hypothetical protein Ctob_001784 [Chrysochromulina sp. CCMP291]
MLQGHALKWVKSVSGANISPAQVGLAFSGSGAAAVPSAETRARPERGVSILDKLIDSFGGGKDGVPVQFRPMNPLCDAAEQGNLPVLTQLVSTGTDVNMTGENGNSALAFACANGHADCTALLISKGAQANQRSSLGNAPLHAAAWADSLKCIRILVDAQADVDLKSFSGATPLHVAIQGGREAALAALLSFGASRTLKDGNGKTPMQLALSMGHTECVSVLKQSQAESEARERVRLCAEREVAEKRANAAAEALLRELELEEAASSGTQSKSGKASKKKAAKKAAKAAELLSPALPAPTRMRSSAQHPTQTPRAVLPHALEEAAAVNESAVEEDLGAIDDQASEDEDAAMACALLGQRSGGRKARNHQRGGQASVRLNGISPSDAVASPSGEVLVEHRARSGNADEIAARILRRLTREGTAAGRRSFSMPEQGFTFRIAWGAGGGQAFVCMERGVGEPGAWRLLGRMRQRWEQRFGPGATAVSAHAASPFASVLAEVCARPEAAADGGGAEDELSVVNQQLEQIDPA